jgi:hypothetical protein
MTDVDGAPHLVVLRGQLGLGQDQHRGRAPAGPRARDGERTADLGSTVAQIRRVLGPVPTRARPAHARFL